MSEFEHAEIDYGSYAKELHLGIESRLSNAGIMAVGIFIDAAGDPVRTRVDEISRPSYLEQS